MAATPKTIPDTRPDRDIYLYGHFLHTLFFSSHYLSRCYFIIVIIGNGVCESGVLHGRIENLQCAPTPNAFARRRRIFMTQK